MTSLPVALCAAGASASIVLQPAAAQDAESHAVSHHDQLHALFRDEFAWRMREFPEWAMQRGDYSNADRITDTSLAAIERRQSESLEFLDRLQTIPREGLDQRDRLLADLFAHELRVRVDEFQFRTFLAPLGGRSGPQQDIPQMHERVRFRDKADYENYLKRLERVPRQIEQTLELLKLGLQEGRTPPKVSVRSVPDQFKALVAGGLDALAEPFDPSHQPPAGVDLAPLKERFRSHSLPALRAALEELAAYCEQEYLPRCRESIAATDWPNGQAYYAFMLRSMTTTNLSARQIHELGLGEVARIRAEMMSVIRSSDYMQSHAAASKLGDADLFRAFVQYLRTDPRFYYKTGDELLAGYRDTCKRIDAELPHLFRVLPRLPYGVREVPAFMAPSQTTAYYQRGDIRNGQAGVFYANTYALDQRPRYEMVSLAMHEAVPGHHLQIALMQELEGVPDFRQEGWFNAFGEGWALYSERLGLEVGLYRDPYDNFGRLLYEMWRACRLVVDPGMHALGWSREKAVQFMLDNTALSALNINNEIDRYIGWPGQACSYKIGELKIRELRTKAEQSLGAKFDLREFHDVVLSAGALPLSILEQRVNDWLEERGKSPATTN